MAALPVIFCMILVVWHIITLYQHSLTDRVIAHAAILGIGACIGFVSLLFYDAKKPSTMYAEKLIEPLRTTMIGISCFLIAGTYFVTFSQGEPIYVQIGFMAGALGYFETATIANRFGPHFSLGENPVSLDSIRNLLAYRIMLVFLVYVISIGALYVSLMGVLGFTSVWSVLFFASVLFLTLAALTKIRRI